MPNPRGPLPRAMPLPAIAAANKEIGQFTTKTSKRDRYHRYAAKERTDYRDVYHTALLDGQATISTLVYFCVVTSRSIP